MLCLVSVAAACRALVVVCCVVFVARCLRFAACFAVCVACCVLS